MPLIAAPGEPPDPMYKLMTIGTLLLGLALAPVFGGSTEEDEGAQGNDVLRPSEPDGRGVKHDQEPGAHPVRSCEWDCQVCEPGLGCNQICTEIGDCGSACNMIAQCDADHVWDESSCSCS